MKCSLKFTFFATLFAIGSAAPFNLNDIFAGFEVNSRLDAPVAQQDLVKRQVEANPDGELKQISFQSLIGNIENGLFESALSVAGASAPGSVVEEIKPIKSDAAQDEHSISKRADESKALDSDTSINPVTQQILVQTTKKVPEGEDGVPAHLVIDRVSVQPHTGGFPLIPTFQVHHTKLVSATIKEDGDGDSGDNKQTKISITKTSITSTAAVENPEAHNSSSVVVTVTPSPEGSSSSAAPESVPSSTTEQPILKLKQVEEQLKEKVAEVEAEPIILSARV